MNSIGELIDRLQIGRSEVARLCGVSYNTVYKWCKGLRRPKPIHLKKLSKLLNVKMSELFKIVYGGVRMNKYDSKKLLTLLQRNHTGLKELIEHPAMYRWNAKTVNEVLKGEREISERCAKDIEKSTGIPLTEFLSDEYKSANQPNYSGEKLFDFMAKKGITTKEIECKMRLDENTVWKIITGKEVFTKSIAKGIAKLYNLSDDFFMEDEERSKCCFLGEQCRILIDTKCASCAFFKTKEQFIKDREEAKQKLIDEKKWDYFVEKYPILKGI